MSIKVPVRVTVLDTWEDFRLEPAGDTPVRDVKRTALAAARVPDDPDEYVLKYDGAEVDDDLTLDGAGIRPNSALIVLPRDRRPVR